MRLALTPSIAPAAQVTRTLGRVTKSLNKPVHRRLALTQAPKMKMGITPRMILRKTSLFIRNRRHMRMIFTCLGQRSRRLEFPRWLTSQHAPHAPVSPATGEGFPRLAARLNNEMGILKCLTHWKRRNLTQNSLFSEVVPDETIDSTILENCPVPDLHALVLKKVRRGHLGFDPCASTESCASARWLVHYNR